jgi:hypothetical protein
MRQDNSNKNRQQIEKARERAYAKRDMNNQQKENNRQRPKDRTLQ